MGFNHGGLRAVCSLVMSWVPIGTEKTEIQPCRGPSRLRNPASLLVLKLGPTHELFSLILTRMMAEFSISSRAKKTNTIVAELLRACVTRGVNVSREELGI